KFRVNCCPGWGCKSSKFETVTPSNRTGFWSLTPSFNRLNAMVSNCFTSVMGINVERLFVVRRKSLYLILTVTVRPYTLFRSHHDQTSWIKGIKFTSLSAIVERSLSKVFSDPHDFLTRSGSTER